MDDADLEALAALRNQSLKDRTRPAPLIIIEDFLPPQIHDRVLEGLIAREGDFWSNRTDGRDALVIVDPPEARPVIDEIERRFDEIVGALAAQGAPVADIDDRRIEIPSATATGHANFHAPHIDNDPTSGIEEALPRRISFVWHAFTQPRAFEGGDLRLWDHSEIPSERGPWTPASSWSDHRCEDNSLVAFSSYSLHEVLPVHMHGGAFANHRFAVVTAAHGSSGLGAGHRTLMT